MVLLPSGEPYYEYGGGSSGAKPTLAADGYALEFPGPMPMLPYGALTLEFSTPVRWTGSARAAATIDPQFGTLSARDSSNQIIADWVPDLELWYPDPVMTLGQLLSSNLPVVASPGDVLPEGLALVTRPRPRPRTCCTGTRTATPSTSF